MTHAENSDFIRPASTSHGTVDAVPGALAPLIAIVGPTASGKSALAVALAQRFGGEVLACDSTQVYRGFDIGTAKPAIEERGGIAHHLMDMVEPTERFTAGEYRRLAEEALTDVTQRRRLPILTVGTGLYLRALLEGLAEAPQRSDELRARLDAAAARRGGTHLHRMLLRLDPASAGRIAPRDRQKLIRALEVCLLSGKPLTELHQAGRSPLRGYATLKIGLSPPRAELTERIELRLQSMLERGWVAEVAGLLAHGWPETAKPFDFLGYRELRAHLQNGQPLSEVFSAIVVATRQYAKRQITWFRKEPGVHWFSAAGESRETVDAVCALIEQHCSNFPR